MMREEPGGRARSGLATRRPRRPRVVAPGVLALALLVPAGCSEPGRSADPPGTPATGRPFDTGEPCPPGPRDGLPPGAGCVTQARADLDGDGRADRASVFARTVAGRPVAWYLRADLAPGIARSTRLAGFGFSYPRLIGTIDLDGDGADELFVKVLDHQYHSGSTRVIEVFALRPGRIAAVPTDGGDRLTFTAGGLSRLGEGARCVPTEEGFDLHVLRAEALDRRNRVWATSERVYRFVRGSLQPVDHRRARLRIEDYNDPALDPYFELRCGEIEVS